MVLEQGEEPKRIGLAVGIEYISGGDGVGSNIHCCCCCCFSLFFFLFSGGRMAAGGCGTTSAIRVDGVMSSTLLFHRFLFLLEWGEAVL